jgi:hypothetical protein
MAAFSSRTIEQSEIAVAVDMRSGWALRHPSPRKSPGPKIAMTASLPTSETTLRLHLAFLDIEDGVRPVALRENHLILGVVGNRPALANLSQKELGIENRL